jgi:hypothetical protein
MVPRGRHGGRLLLAFTLLAVGCQEPAETPPAAPSPGIASAGIASPVDASPATASPDDAPSAETSPTDDGSQVSPSAEVVDSVAGLITPSDARDDPLVDGWNSEVFSAAAGEVLTKVLGGLAADPLPVGSLAQMVASDCRIGEFRPAARREVYSDGSMTVWRGEAGEQATASGSRRGPEGLQAAIEALRVAYADAVQVRKKVKIVRVDSTGQRSRTSALLEVAAVRPTGLVQIHASLEATWQIVRNESPRLASLAVTAYEEVVSAAPHTVHFHDVTASILQGESAYREEFLVSSDTWAERTETQLGSDFMGYHGVSVADVDGDGLDDLYVCQPGGLPNRLFLQQPDGMARDASHESGLDLLDSSRSALLVDLDGDGDQDAVVATVAGMVLLENTGGARFDFRQIFPQARQAYSLAAADYNGDGTLDLYACLYHAPAGAAVGNPMPYHDARNGSPNVFVVNRGDWRFVDGTREVGLDENNNRWSYAASWEDYDNDGDPDLYVANDFGRNNLYENNDGKFRDVAARAGVEDIASGMSVVWGDYDRNGTMDLYVSNMYSSAGGRITYQRQFNPDARGSTRANLQRLARGNSLFLNRGDGTFEDVSLEAGVNMARWAWGSAFADVNSDGFDDLLVVNGNYTGEDTGDL